MTGRPPKPTALKILNGSAAHHPERTNGAEPKAPPLTAIPVPPFELSEVALAAWQRNASAAVGLGVLTAADLDTLAVACEAFAEYRTALKARDGWRRADAARKFYVTTLGKFGLNASDRTRLRVEPVPDADPMIALLTPIRSKRRA